MSKKIFVLASKKSGELIALIPCSLQELKLQSAHSLPPCESAENLECRESGATLSNCSLAMRDYYQRRVSKEYIALMLEREIA